MANISIPSVLRVVINGDLHQFPAGITILEALGRLRIDLPALCYDERLKACGACRLCEVEIAGWNRFATACTTPLADGMVIQTHSPAIERSRQGILTLLVQHYPGQAVLSFPEKEFHRYLKQYG